MFGGLRPFGRSPLGGYGVIWSVSVTEAGSAVDTQDESTTNQVVESGDAVDTQSVLADFNGVVAEFGNAVDAPNWTPGTYNVSVTEAGNVQDLQSAPVFHVGFVKEAGSAIDTIEVNFTLQGYGGNKYTNLITSEHFDKPKFFALVAFLTNMVLAVTDVVNQLSLLFDLDTATGVQLDIVGEWIGATRFVNIPSNVYFTLDDSSLGFDTGIWWEPFNPTTTVARLPDDYYRVLLYAKVIANQWNGTIPAIYASYQTLFGPQSDTQVLVQDRDNMSMDLAIVGVLPDPLTTAMITGGYLNFKPAGVKLGAYMFTSVPGAPLFGFDVENANIAGFDVGGWATIVAPPTP